MLTYNVKFSNTYQFEVSAISRAEAIEKAVKQTKGIFSDKQQKANLQFCRLKKQ